jgi:ankyrin repeat protein
MYWNAFFLLFLYSRSTQALKFSYYFHYIVAADQGFNDVVICLLNAGARVDAADQEGISVLQAAVIAGQTETCRILWQQGKADPDQPDHDGDTPRLCAQDDGSREMKLLFGLYKEEGADAGAALNEGEDDDEEEDNVTEANTTAISEDVNVTAPESLQRKGISQEIDELVEV